MMRTNRWLFTGALLILMSPMMAMGQMWSQHEVKMQKLNLSAEQQTQIEQLATDHHKKMITLRAEAQVARINLNEAIRSGDSEKEVQKKVDAVSEAQKALLQERVTHQLQVRDIVGEENFELWKKMQGPRKRGFHRMERPGREYGMEPGKGSDKGPNRW